MMYAKKLLRNPFFYLSCALAFYNVLHYIFTDRRRITTRKLAVLFGDSITQHGFNPSLDGWIAALAHEYSRKIDFINRGFSGYNSKWGLRILEKSVISLSPDLVVLFFGANDAVFEQVQQYCSLQEYSSNLSAMIKLVKAGNSQTKILLLTPPPIAEDMLKKYNSQKGKSVLLDRTNERTYEVRLTSD
jgi:isoamyl acetate esterase